MDFFAGLLAPILDALAIWTGSFGIAIIILTVIVRLVLYPLSYKQLQSAAKMQEMQPKMQELQQKYKDKPEEFQKRVLELYKEHNVNPFSGCLPMLIQIPVMYGLFRVLTNFPERLAQDARLQETISIVFLGMDLTQRHILLGALAALTWMLVTLTMPGDKQQKMVTLPMAAMFAVVGFMVPAGLALYFCVSNLFSALERLRMRSLMPAPAARKG